jgi:ribosomal protein S15P/S13E
LQATILLQNDGVSHFSRTDESIRPAQKCDKENAALRGRLQVVEDLLADNRQQLERLLDLYLSRDFTRDILTERKSRLEKTAAALEGGRVDLNAHLETQTIAEEQVRSLQDFATEVAKDLESADKDFETRRRLVEMLDAQVTLAVEDNQKVIHARCLPGASLLQADRTAPHTWHGDSECTVRCSAGRR